ncbi:hypothetical protein PMAYCL1PPCAC_19549 [Pristionchus mayeri]|uniref:RRM domain-containing protein n=1 Tax=Pristionchus mayeri TaxID=1317129 RepID=A0AAN5CRR4_9BILA|nr:hypothetical protein PMAYCL1PPCAC_19549 [Pristionchus mayeri]
MSDKNRRSKKEMIVIDDYESTNKEPVEKSVKSEPETDTSMEVAELRQKLIDVTKELEEERKKSAKVEDKYQRAVREAGKSWARIEHLEGLIDQKPVIIDNNSKKMNELEQKVCDLTKELDEERRISSERIDRIDELTSNVNEYKLQLLQSKQTSESLHSNVSKKRKNGKEINEGEKDNRKKKARKANGDAMEEGEIDEAPKRGRDAQDQSQVVVRKVPAEAYLSEVESLFSSYSGFVKVHMPRNADGSHRGFAFVDFRSPWDVKQIWNEICKPKYLHGKKLACEKAWSVIPSVEEERVKYVESRERGLAMDKGHFPRGSANGLTVWANNLSSRTNNAAVDNLFRQSFDIAHAMVLHEFDPIDSWTPITMAEVKFKTREDANRALETMQGAELDGRSITLTKKKVKGKEDPKQIIVSNVPAKARFFEVRSLFSLFTGFKKLSMAKDASGNNRDFGFVDFNTEDDAKIFFRANQSPVFLHGKRLNFEHGRSAINSVEIERRRYVESRESELA